MVAKEYSVGYIKSDIEVYKTLCLRAQSVAILALLEIVWIKSGPTMKVVLINIRGRSIYNHQTILAALQSSNVQNLVSAIRADISSGLGMLLSLYILKLTMYCAI